jgi:hypothetical protein
MERPERANTLPVLLIRPVIRTDVRRPPGIGHGALTPDGVFALAFGTLFSSQGTRPPGPETRKAAGHSRRPPSFGRSLPLGGHLPLFGCQEEVPHAGPFSPARRGVMQGK